MKKVFIPFVAITVPMTALVIWKYYSPSADLNEEWLYEMMPAEMESAQMRQSTLGETVTYRMDESTYEVLEPIGIACQIWSTPEGEFDVVIIAGESMKSFHDQKICFNAQGWNIRDLRQRILPTESHGDIPFTVMELDRRDGNVKWGIYTFRPPTGFGDFRTADLGFMINEIKTGQPGTGYSYRFIGMSDGLTEDQVFDFAKRYMERVKESSNGIL